MEEDFVVETAAGAAALVIGSELEQPLGGMEDARFGVGVVPFPAVEFSKGIAAPVKALGGRAIEADVHHGTALAADLTGLAEGELVGKAGDTGGLGGEFFERGAGSAGQDEEEGGGEQENEDARDGGKGGKTGADARWAARNAEAGAARGAADFATGEGADGEEQEQNEEDEEVGIGGEHRGGEEFEEGDEFEEEEVAAGAGSEELGDGDEEDEVNGGGEEIAGEQKVVGGEEGDVGEGSDGDPSGRDIELEAAGELESTGEQGETSE